VLSITDEKGGGEVSRGTAHKRSPGEGDCCVGGEETATPTGSTLEPEGKQDPAKKKKREKVSS